MKPKLPKMRILNLAVADMLHAAETPPGTQGGELRAATDTADDLDFPEGREDPEQSAELERQQDA